MKKFLTVIFLLSCRICIGQNLVPNPSFEDTVHCPQFYSDVNYCVGWSSCGPTPDYYNSCSSNWVGVPNNFVGHQLAFQGEAYCGAFAFISFGSNAREIIGRQLSSALIIGTKYFATVKVSLADSIQLASNNFGINFSMTSMANNSSVFIGKAKYPKVYSSNVITNYSNWVTISGSFIADSAYQFIEIGNFLNDTLTTTINSPSPGAYFGGSYYYIDDVCVSTDSLLCPSSAGIEQMKQNEEIKIFPNPFSNSISISTNNSEPSQFILYDLLSRKILQQTFTNATTVNTSQLADGIYIYEVRNKNGTTTKGKVVKQ